VHELQVALGCGAWDAACAGQVADAAGAGTALTLTLGSLDGGGLSLEGRVVDVGGEHVAAPVRLALPGAGADDLRVAEAWVKGVVASGAPTMLVVTSDLDGDDVLVDGLVVGRTPLVLSAVTPGEHVLSLRRAGRAPLVRSLTVKAGVVNREHAPFAAGPPALGSSAPLSSTPPVAPPTPTAGWAMAGVGAVVGGAGGIVAAAWGLPLVEIGNNQSADAAGRAVIARRYTTLDGRTLEGAARLAHLRSALYLSDDAPIHDAAVLGAALEQAVTTANTGFVLLAAGALVGATGVAMALLAPEDGAAPPSSPPPSSPPPASSPASSP
jgi:hypothetical protein